MLPRLSHRYGPIGVDIGARSIKLLQLSGDHSRLIEAARVDLPPAASPATPRQEAERIVPALSRGLADRNFRGRDAVLCLPDQQVIVQSVRVPKHSGTPLDRLVAQEAAARIPFGVEEAEIRYLEAADVRQGDQMLREVILFAVRRTLLHQTLELIEEAHLRPLAVDVEPAALVRSYAAQYRRDSDRHDRALLVHVGYSRTTALITQAGELLLAKHIDIGGQHLDLAVARHLKMDLPEAVSLRRHSGDRRADIQDPEVAHSVAEATRGLVERLASELTMCIRYHSVTFRGQPLARLVLSGGEASPQLLDSLGRQLDLNAELSDPLRALPLAPHLGRKGQWDIAAGLAMRELN